MKAGKLVKYCYIDKIINETMRHTKESVGVVIVPGIVPRILDSETGEVHEALYIIEVYS